MELVIGNKNYSSWSLRPWILMQHFGLDFSERHISLMTEQMQAQMAPLCPNYKVPVLLDQAEKIWDSLSICEYINEQYLDEKAWPKSPISRARARSICAEMHSGFHGLREQLPMNCRREVKYIAPNMQCQKDIDRIVEIWQQCMAQHIDGPFLFGEFSIVDAYYMPVVSRFNTYQVAVPAEVTDYMRYMLALPSYQLWLSAARQEQAVITEEEV